MDHAIFTGQKIWCPRCKDLRQFLQVPNAARLLDVDRRTVYRYIEEGRVHAFKPAAIGNYRVCSRLSVSPAL